MKNTGLKIDTKLSALERAGLFVVKMQFEKITNDKAALFKGIHSKQLEVISSLSNIIDTVTKVEDGLSNLSNSAKGKHVKFFWLIMGLS